MHFDSGQSLMARPPDNAYFADGIQEEILSRFSKIADR